MKRLFIIVAVCVAVMLAAYFALRYNQESEVANAHPAPAHTEATIDVKSLEAKAKQGDSQAQIELGQAYSDGLGVKPDYKLAAHWYGVAASNGDVEAEVKYGELCQGGRAERGVSNAAVKWFTKASQAGSAAAQYNLGYLYERGQKVPHDEKAAAHWFQLAAEGGDALAQFAIGQRLTGGLGVAADPVEGLKWLLIAAGHGQPDAGKSAKAAEADLKSDQVEEAQKRAAAFVPRPAKPASVNK